MCACDCSKCRVPPHSRCSQVNCVQILCRCRLLVHYGASIESTDTRWLTPLHHAAINGHADVCKLLVSTLNQQATRRRAKKDKIPQSRLPTKPARLNSGRHHNVNHQVTYATDIMPRHVHDSGLDRVIVTALVQVPTCPSNCHQSSQQAPAEQTQAPADPEQSKRKHQCQSPPHGTLVVSSAGLLV